MNHLQTASTILSAAQKVETMGNTVSGKLLALFKECESIDEFNDVCGEAEKLWKEKRVKQKESTNLPACWSQAKSDIKGAVKAGVDVQACDTVSQAKRLKGQANKASKPKTASAKGATSAPVSIKQGASAPEQPADVAGMTKLLEILGKVSEPVREALIDSFIAQTERAISAAESEVLTTESKDAKVEKTKLAKVG